MLIPRSRTAGTMGIVSGIALIMVTVLFLTSGATPDTPTDPAQALAFLDQHAGRVRTIGILGLITLAAVVPFIAGLAGTLRERAPTRASAVLYFGLLGLVGHGISTLVFMISGQALVAYAATDPTAAGQAWLTLFHLRLATDSFGNILFGLATLLAGWAIVATRTFGAGLGWYGVLAGAVTLAGGLAPAVDALYLGALLFPIVWLIWAGATLRRTAV